MAEQAGDAFVINESKNSNYYDNETSFLTEDDSKEFQFTYPMLMETEISKFKKSMESWRELALRAKSVLIWEKQWHSTALIGGCTILFTLLWLFDPSILTIFSLLGLMITLADYFIPSLNYWFKTEKWSADKEKEFDDLCTDLVLCKVKCELACASYFKMRITNRKMYFAITVTALAGLAWIGCTFNNLFLSYVLVTFALLYPGLEHQGIITKGSGKIRGYIFDILNKGAAQSRIKFE